MAKYSTTLATLIQRIAQSFDDCVMGQVQTSASNSTTVFYDATRTEADDYFNNWDCHFYAGTHIDTTRVISDFASTTDLTTISPAVTGACDTTDYYQLHKRFKWAQYKAAVDRAIDMGKHYYLLNKKDDTAVQNRISNWDFESATAGWTVTGAGASAAISSTYAAHGTYSYKLTVAAADCYGYQNVSSPRNFRGKDVKLRCWVYAAAASQTYIAVYDGVTTTKSSYHSGDSTWELLEVEHAVSEDNTVLQVRLGMLAGAGSAYFDMPVITEDNYRELTIPSGFTNISEIWYESVAESTNFDTKISNLGWWIVKDGTTPVIRFDTHYNTATGFRIIGQSVQDALTADTSVCYLPPEFVVQQARALLAASRTDTKDLVQTATSLAMQERAFMSTPPAIGAKPLYEV